LAQFQLGMTRVAAVNRKLQDRNIFLTKIRDRLLQAQNLMKAAHDKSHRPLEFVPGDLVWLCLNQRAAVSVRNGPLSKLAPKYYGSYHVRERIGGLAYSLQLLAWARIHDVFHIAFLKKYTDTELGDSSPTTDCAWLSCVTAPAGGARSPNRSFMGSVGEVAEQFIGGRVMGATGSIQGSIPRFSS
jgi:hypothetical protein